MRYLIAIIAVLLYGCTNNGFNEVFYGVPEQNFGYSPPSIEEQQLFQGEPIQDLKTVAPELFQTDKN